MEKNSLNYALDRMIAARDSYLLEITVEGEENVFPMMPPGTAVNEMVLS